MKQLDRTVQKRITKFLSELASLADPRSKGKSLVGNLMGFWRYRVGDYRILCRIHDEELEILVVEVG
ncbi:MAG: type II toxin-antitoxin system RelE/ParE family toxin, partial [Treponemataceae bacterium]|nr:type II toxin-antitoxin system RelE/ParE family toxin [Treponemataceae bacterium]